MTQNEHSRSLVERWGFERNDRGEMVIGGVSAVELARRHGTPLHVVDEGVLRRRAREFRESFERRYRDVRCFFSVKSNSVSQVVRTVCDEGYGAQVMSGYELWLAQKLGIPGKRIVVNGPNKGDELLKRSADPSNPATVIVDSLTELGRLESLAEAPIDVLLRVCPDFTPEGMNEGSSMGSLAASPFGLDLHSDEFPEALDRIKRSSRVRYLGLHAHVGTGIREARDFAKAFETMKPAFRLALERGLKTQVFNFGGGFGLANSKLFSVEEFLAYQGMGALPSLGSATLDFADQICAPLEEFCSDAGIKPPTLYLEPGRSIVGPAQVLLLTVGVVKDRPRRGLPWVIADGGAGTHAFPLHYEYHEVLLANKVDAPAAGPVSMVGPACFTADWIYRKKEMPALRADDVIAVMDSGAYFLAFEAGFGYPKSAVVLASRGRDRLIRRRESYEDMSARDIVDGR